MEGICFLTILGVVVALSVLTWIGLHAEEFVSDRTSDDSIRVIHRSRQQALPGNAQGRISTQPSTQQPTAEFQTCRQEGRICWRTGMPRCSCPCESCTK